MMDIDRLDALRRELQAQKKESQAIRITVGMATCGIAAGARPVYDALCRCAEKNKSHNIDVVGSGCIGVCHLEPIVEVSVPGEDKVTYVNMTPEKAERIIAEHIIGKTVVTEYAIGSFMSSSHSDEGSAYSLCDTDFYKYQKRIVLRNCGNIDPESIDEYIEAGGYSALSKALTQVTPAQVVNEIKVSGLRGRGGAGFPTGMKWEFTAAAAGDVKYVCCTADEGDPGAFMDRAVLEGDPYSVIEAMSIAGYAIGSHQGYIYVRAEYPIAVERLNKAIALAEERSLLGENILGTGFDFRLETRLGSGAFVCGEETSLMRSVEGKRGEPTPRPPFPANKGLFGKPTLLNNVETYANITWIINNGADAYSSIGTDGSNGTKVFALGGKIVNTGLVEIPMGTPLRTVIEDIGGGVPNGKAFKAVQTGGPSGACISFASLDIPIDYDSLAKIGAMIGSGGMIVLDEDNCMVDIAKFFLQFTVDESCGKCTPCRVGIRRMLELLDRITAGNGTPSDIDRLEELAIRIKATALCGLGQTAPNPVISTIRNFRDEYIAHVTDKKCPAGVCKNLFAYIIDPDKCRGCSACAAVCPAGAISGELKKPFVIDEGKCIACGSCIAKCKFDAIRKD